MWKRLIPWFILAAYGVILVLVMVFKGIPTIRFGQLMLNFGGTYEIHAANFVPFTTIVPYLLGKKGLIIAGVNIVGNIVPLIPLGFLVPLVYRNMTWQKSLALAAASGLLIEIMQTLLRMGIFDIDDVILNAFGVMIGYWAFIILSAWMRAGKYKHIVIAMFMVAAITAAALYAIYPKDQLFVNPRADVSDIDAQGNEEDDLCGGTGGTGEIIQKEESSITIRRQDGVVRTINLTDRTMIRTSAGPATESDLKMGDHVTVVIDESETATTVLVCS